MKSEFARLVTGRKIVGRKFLLLILIIVMVGIFSLNLTFAIMNHQQGINYSISKMSWNFLFFNYFSDVNGDGFFMLGIDNYRTLEFYPLQPTGLPSWGEFFFYLFNISSDIRSADLRALGLCLGILVAGIALASIYYIRKRMAFKR